jgi:hypothetical protein
MFEPQNPFRPAPRDGRDADFIVDLNIPLEIAAESRAEAERVSAAWFAGLRQELSPGLLLSHAVMLDPLIIRGRCALALRLRADCAAQAIGRIPNFHERLNTSGLLHVGDWRGGVSVRPRSPYSPIRIV